MIIGDTRCLPGGNHLLQIVAPHHLGIILGMGWRWPPQTNWDPPPPSPPRCEGPDGRSSIQSSTGQQRAHTLLTWEIWDTNSLCLGLLAGRCDLWLWSERDGAGSEKASHDQRSSCRFSSTRHNPRTYLPSPTGEKRFLMSAPVFQE